MQTSAKIVEDSVSTQGVRLTTLQLCYPRLIHSEFMTHRVFSRSASGSRAIPVAKVLEQVRLNPAKPAEWGSNQPGMQAGPTVDNPLRAELLWRAAANSAADMAERMARLGLHKQICNRPLEPFTYMHTVLTATEFENWFSLRLHRDADPTIYQLALEMRLAMDASTPKVLQVGQWHLPYVSETERQTLDSACLPKISAARCARVSYLKHDGKVPDVEKDLGLFDRLAGSHPMHASPLEHQATPAGRDSWSGNFRGWLQHRKVWEQSHDGSTR